MTTWDADWQDFLADATRRGPARAPSTIGEAWSSEWKRSGLGTLTGIGRPLDEAYGELVAGYEKAAGRSVSETMPQLAASASTDERARMIRDASATLPEEQRKALEPLFDVRRRASEKAQKIETEANEVYASTYGLSGIAASFGAGIARQALDPVNLAALPLGGPLRGPLLKVIAREAGIGGLTQLIQEPVIQSGRAELGLEAGFGHGAANVAQAALGAGGLTALFRAGAWAIRRIPGRAAEGVDAFSGDGALPDTVGGRNNAPTDSPLSRAVLPEDLEAAARVFERDQLIDASTPPTFTTSAHAEGVEAAGRAIERGADIPAPATPPPQLVVARHMPDGTVRYGEPGQIHADLVDAAEIRAEPFIPPPTDAMGFAVPGEKFMSREQAAAWVKQNEPAREVKYPGPSGMLAEHYNATPEIKPTEPPAPTAAPPPLRPKKGPAARDPETWSLFEFIASRGGLKPDPELDLLLGGHNPLVPGFGPLIRKTGLSLDRARAAAVEFHYLIDSPDLEAVAGRRMQSRPTESTINDLLGAIDRQARGERQYRIGREGTETAADARARAEREAADVASEIDARFREAEIDPSTVDPVLRKRVTEMFTREGETDVAVAFERAVMEDSERFERAARARRETAPDIPGWDFPADPGATPGGGGKPARRSGPGGAEDRGQSRPGGDADRTPPGEAGESGLIGDPILAKEVERIIAEHGDFEIFHDGGKLKFSEAMQIAAADDRAARELTECIGAVA